MEISNNVRLLLFVIINSQKIMLILLIYFSQSNITFSFISPLFLPFSFVKEIFQMYCILLTARNDATVREINKYSNSTIKNRRNFSERIYDSIADQSRSFRALYGTNHVSHTFSGRDIGEIKFTTPFTIPLEKKLWRVRYSISSTSCMRFVDE